MNHDDRAFDAVLFDFGGVFIGSPFAVADAAAADLGLTAEQLTAYLFGPYDRDTDHPWHRLERGQLSFAEARAAIRGLAAADGHEVDPLAVLAGMADTDRHGVRQFMVDVARDARVGGLRTSVVTNNIAEFGSTWKSMVPVEELFDDIVDSSAVGVRKPDPSIYLMACDRLSVVPERAVFLDDFEGNVEAARAVGLTRCGWAAPTTRRWPPQRSCVRCWGCEGRSRNRPASGAQAASKLQLNGWAVVEPSSAR